MKTETYCAASPNTAEIFGDPIFSYSRAQAIAAGVLVDVTHHAACLGFRFPTAVTAGLWSLIDIDGGDNNRFVSRVRHLDTVLVRAREAIRAVGNRDTDRVTFSALGNTCWAHIGPGDAGEPVITLLLMGED